MLKVYFLDDEIQNNLQASSFYIIAPYQKVGGVSFAEFSDLISCCPVLNAVLYLWHTGYTSVLCEQWPAMTTSDFPFYILALPSDFMF